MRKDQWPEYWHQRDQCKHGLGPRCLYCADERGEGPLGKASFTYQDLQREYRKDAERYRWLRLEIAGYKHVAGHDVALCIAQDSFRVPEQLDKAIDAAISAESDAAGETPKK